MTSNPYAAVGRCIYCDSAIYDAKRPGQRLGNEHIIAYSLGGTLVLPEASCANCETTINKVETNLTRGMFLPARTQLLYPTSNKKERPKHLPLDIDGGSGLLTKQIPIEDYPGMLVVLRFTPPLALLNIAPADTPLTGGVAIATLPNFGDNLNKHPRRTVTWKMGGDAPTYGRMLAKIAHAYTVAELGYGRFKPVLLDIILNRPPLYMTHFVGGEIGDPPAARAERFEISHTIETLSDGRKLILVRIRLFADRQGMPTYLVVSGEIIKVIEVTK